MGVGFAVEAAGRDDGGCFRIVNRAEAKAQAGGKELTGKLRLATETVDNPRHCRTLQAAKLGDTRGCAHGMYNQRLAHAFGNGGMTQEDAFLHVERRATESVEACLADCHNTRVGGEGFDAGEHGVDIGIGSVPRVYAVGKMGNIAPRVDVERHVDNCVSPGREAVGVYVGKLAKGQGAGCWGVGMEESNYRAIEQSKSRAIEG